MPALLGYEFGVNTATALGQSESVNATKDDGTRSVVVWTHQYSSSDKDIRAQVYDGAGNRVGGEIWVAWTGLNEYEPSVGMDYAGNFVVAFTVENGGNRDVRYSRFTSEGAQLSGGSGGNPVATSANREYDPDVAVSGDGSFVVAYTRDWSATDQDVHARVYSASGTELAWVPAANGYEAETRPSVAVAGNTFVVAYQEQNPSTGISEVRAASVWYRSTPGDWGYMYGIGAGLLVSVPGRYAANPDVAINTESGASMVAYQTYNYSNWDIHTREVGATGYPGEQVNVIAATAANETNPSIAHRRGSNGHGAVAYQSVRSDGYTRIVVTENLYGSGPAYELVNSSYAANLSAPSVSVASAYAQNRRYLVTYSYRYTSPYFYYNGGTDVYGRFGQF